MAIFKSKTVTKDGRKWYFSVCYVTASGERKRKKGQLYTTKPEAQEAERQFMVGANNNRVDITFEELYYKYTDYIDEKIKGSTKYTKHIRVKNNLLPYIGKMNIHNITTDTVINWKTKMNKTVYAKGKQYCLHYKLMSMSDLRAILKYGVNFCGLKENVANKVMMFHSNNEDVITDEEKVKYIKPEEYNLFISVIDELVFKVFFAFLYYMGVRKGEAQALNWNDVLWDANQIRIVKTITTKTNELNEQGIQFKITNTKNRKNRTIKMPSILKGLLAELYEHYKEYEGFNDEWFVFGGDRHLSDSSITSKKDYYFDLVKKQYNMKVNRITNHEFRHSHASYLISQGIKIELIAYRLGDTVSVVQKTYAHLFPEVEDDIIEELGLIDSSPEYQKAKMCTLTVPNT